jgi:signal transduction histidine kinase
MTADLATVPLGAMACYLGLAAYMLLKRRLQTATERDFFVYLIALATWNASIALSMIVPEKSALTMLGERAALGGLAILSIVFLKLTHAFLRQSSEFTVTWWILGMLSLAIVILFNPESAPLNLPTVIVGQFSIVQDEIAQLFNITIWAGFTIASILATRRVYREISSPTHRNRYRYLFLSVGLLVIGDLVFAKVDSLRLLGVSFKLVSTFTLALAILRHNLVDIKRLYRQALSYIAVSLLTIAINLAVVWISFNVTKKQDLQSTLLSVGVASILVSFVFSPTRRAFQRFIDRKLFHVDMDYQMALRAYSERVIETLDLESLADLVVETLISATGAHRGGLYLIHEGQHEIGSLSLDQIKSTGDLASGDFSIHPDSALAHHLRDSDTPLTQYEIDLEGAFATLPADEREWLHKLAIEVLIPIHTQHKPVGLMVLGAKRSDESYSHAELEWLKAMASQTAVALQNARLFDQVQSMSVNVMRLNADLQRAYQQLQQVDNLKSGFLSVISHELRSPFVAAGLSVQLLYRYAQEGMVDELRHQTEQLDRQLAEGRRMIDSLIAFASLLSKRGELHLEEMDVAELIHSTIAPLKKVASVREITMSCKLSPQLSLIPLDKTRMGEAIYHLVHNAIKFNREGGTVRIACWPTASHIVFKVEDSGCGIPPDKLDNIWDAFTQAADEVRRGVEGMGLGLALVKFVVEAHDGEVWAASKVGEGSTFGFRVPKQPTRDFEVTE